MDRIVAASEVSGDRSQDSTSTSRIDFSGFNTKARSLHELAPYIGKMRPELAAWAIEQITAPGQRVLDPFCGSGTVLLEGWSRGREVVGADLSPYAWLISTAKLLIHTPCTAENVVAKLESYQEQVDHYLPDVNLRGIDEWMRSFYHPRTLRELLTWSWVLRRNEDSLMLASLMAIAHHQRPGFLSYPSSHTVPYLRTAKFPVEEFPELYAYRALRPRLEKKVQRAISDSHGLDLALPRAVHLGDASKLSRSVGVFDAIITSPPYMGQLHYARDNRLRLALLGYPDWREIDKTVSPNSVQFTALIAECLTSWLPLLRKGSRVAILIGDKTNTVKRRLDTFLIDAVAKASDKFRLEGVLESSIPDDRRARKNCRGSSAELLLVFQKKN